MHGYATLFQEVFTEHGLPVAMYGDRTGILVRNDSCWTVEEELRGYRGPTHMGQVLDDLGIGYIEAHSPQAKGRIENRWETLQDRLVQEMRLLGISDIVAANAFLPEFRRDFNKRFAKHPRESESAWRPAPKDLHMIPSCRYLRTVANDNTVTLGPSKEHRAQGESWLDRRWLQIPAGPRRRSYAGCQVEIRELLDGRLVAIYHGIPIAIQPAPKTGFHLTGRTVHRRPRRRTVREQASTQDTGASGEKDHRHALQTSRQPALEEAPGQTPFTLRTQEG
jgi:hypothetical protein